MGITRATVDKNPSDRRSEVLNDLLHWIWSWRVQLKRLAESTREQGSGANTIEKRQSFSCASLDEHLVAVVGWNLIRAIDQTQEVFQHVELELDNQEPVRHLRNLYEHWDEQRLSFQNDNVSKEKSGKKFAAQFPSGQPWSITYEADDWMLGGVVGLNEVSRQLDEIERTILNLEEGLEVS